MRLLSSNSTNPTTGTKLGQLSTVTAVLARFARKSTSALLQLVADAEHRRRLGLRRASGDSEFYRTLVGSVGIIGLRPRTALRAFNIEFVKLDGHRIAHRRARLYEFTATVIEVRSHNIVGAFVQRRKLPRKPRLVSLQGLFKRHSRDENLLEIRFGFHHLGQPEHSRDRRRQLSELASCAIFKECKRCRQPRYFYQPNCAKVLHVQHVRAWRNSVGPISDKPPRQLCVCRPAARLDTTLEPYGEGRARSRIQVPGTLVAASFHLCRQRGSHSNGLLHLGFAASSNRGL
jgi:hypothetical protein